MVISTSRLSLYVSEVGSDGLSVVSNYESLKQIRPESLLNTTRWRNHISWKQSNSAYKCDDSRIGASSLREVTALQKKKSENRGKPEEYVVLSVSVEKGWQ